MKEHRLELLRAALIILRAYFAAGRPKAELIPWGSFEGWSDLVRQAIVWTGYADPYEASQSLRENADPLVEGRSRLLVAMAGLGMNRPHGMTAEIFYATLYGEGAERNDHATTVRDYLESEAIDGKPKKHNVAYLFRSLNTTVYGQLFLEKVGNSNRRRVRPSSEFGSRLRKVSPATSSPRSAQVDENVDGNEW